MKDKEIIKIETSYYLNGKTTYDNFELYQFFKREDGVVVVTTPHLEIDWNSGTNNIKDAYWEIHLPTVKINKYNEIEDEYFGGISILEDPEVKMVKGKTYPIRQLIKQYGFRWNGSLKAWVR